MNTGIISTRYARAIFEYAREVSTAAAPSLYEDMDSIAVHISALPEMSEALRNPTVSPSDKIRLILSACGNPDSEVLKSVVRLVVLNGRAAYMETIALIYKEYYRKMNGIATARLTTVTEASESMKEQLTSLVSQLLNEKEVEFKTRTDPAIIGGFILEIEDKRLDASVKDQLNQLKLDLIHH